MITVSGAYGRDYKSKAAALADWNGEKDFIIRTIGIPGMYISKPEADDQNMTIYIRYSNDRKITPTQ